MSLKRTQLNSAPKRDHESKAMVSVLATVVRRKPQMACSNVH
jgi:hypothetical protein